MNSPLHSLRLLLAGPVLMLAQTTHPIGDMQIISTGVKGTAMPAFARDAGGELTVQQIGALISGMR